MMTHQAPLACLDQLEDRYLFVILDISGFFFSSFKEKNRFISRDYIKEESGLCCVMSTFLL